MKVLAAPPSWSSINAFSLPRVILDSPSNTGQRERNRTLNLKENELGMFLPSRLLYRQRLTHFSPDMALARTPTQETATGTPQPVLLALPGPTFTFRSSSTVTLLVGQSQTSMTVQKSPITRTSEFFATALKKAWLEGQTKLIKLPEEDPVHLTYYLE